MLGHKLRLACCDECEESFQMISILLKWPNLILKTPVYSPRYFYDFVSKSNLYQNRYHLKALFTLITMVQTPASHDLPRQRYYAHHIFDTIRLLVSLTSHVQFGDREANSQIYYRRIRALHVTYM